LKVESCRVSLQRRNMPRNWGVERVNCQVPEDDSLAGVSTHSLMHYLGADQRILDILLCFAKAELVTVDFFRFLLEFG
jgi:hypothetical protein